MSDFTTKYQNNFKSEYILCSVYLEVTERGQFSFTAFSRKKLFITDLRINTASAGTFDMSTSERP